MRFRREININGEYSHQDMILSSSVYGIEELIRKEEPEFLDILRKSDTIIDFERLNPEQFKDHYDFFKTVEAMKKGGMDWLHIDVMTEDAVPNHHYETRYEADVLKEIARLLDVSLDVHLMVKDVEKYIGMYKGNHTEMITFHPEFLEPIDKTGTDEFTGRMIQKIKEYAGKPIKTGTAMNPKAPIVVYKYLEQADLILFMTVNAGFGGQSFMNEGIDNLDSVLARHPEYRNKHLQADGGLKQYAPEDVNLRYALQHGINNVVNGTGITGKYVADRDLAALEKRTRDAKAFIS